MRVLGRGWQKALRGYFDRRADFAAPTGEQDETGQSIERYVPVGGLQHVRCAVGDRGRDRYYANFMGGDAAREESPALLLAGSHPEIGIGWRVEVCGDKYTVTGVTPSQSSDVTEIRMERLHG